VIICSAEPFVAQYQPSDEVGMRAKWWAPLQTTNDVLCSSLAFSYYILFALFSLYDRLLAQPSVLTTSSASRGPMDHILQLSTLLLIDGQLDANPLL
jgi:hypothetical protein